MLLIFMRQDEVAGGAISLPAPIFCLQEHLWSDPAQTLAAERASSSDQKRGSLLDQEQGEFYPTSPLWREVV